MWTDVGWCEGWLVPGIRFSPVRRVKSFSGDEFCPTFLVEEESYIKKEYVDGLLIMSLRLFNQIRIVLSVILLIAYFR